MGEPDKKRGAITITGDSGERQVSLREFKSAAASEVSQDYVPLNQAAKALGMSSKGLLAWCQEHGVQHFEYRKRWVVHRQELLSAFQSPQQAESGE